MKKYSITLLTIVLFVVLGFSAFTAAAEQKIELKVWDVSFNEGYVRWWKNYVKEFNKANPNIEVTYETYETEAFKAKTAASIVAGTMPDIFKLNPGAIAFKYYTEGKVLAIEDLYDVSPYMPGIKEGCSFNGKMIFHPLYMVPFAIYYNKAQFAEAGIDLQKWADPTQPTWDEFIVACDKLKDAGFTPIAIGNASNWPFLAWVWILQNRFGGTKELIDAVSGVGSYTSPGFIKAAEVAQRFAQSGYFPKGFSSIGGNSMYILLTQGNGAMFYFGTWVIGTIKDNAPPGFEYGVFKFPSFPDGNPDSQRDIYSVLTAFAVSSTTKHPEAVAKFLQPLTTSYDVMLSYIKEASVIPAINGILEMAKTAGVDPVMLTVAQHFAEAKHGFGAWDWVLPAPVAEEMLNMSQPLSMGTITPKEFCERLEAKARQK